MKGYDEGVYVSSRSPGHRAGLFVLRNYSIGFVSGYEFRKE
jgi:hypothetical protein